MIERKFFNMLTLMLTLTLTIDIATSAADESRATEPVQETHQRCCGGPMKNYHLITEYKRLPQHRYLAALKRFPDYLYSFGIGKRFEDNIKRNSPYSFGVGKRNPYTRLSLMRVPQTYARPIDSKNHDADHLMDESSDKKRNAPSHAYGFGIGKRNIPLLFENMDGDLREIKNDGKFPDDGQLWDQF